MALSVIEFAPTVTHTRTDGQPTTVVRATVEFDLVNDLATFNALGIAYGSMVPQRVRDVVDALRASILASPGKGIG